MGFGFEKLVAWQKALELSVAIHELTLAWPVEERYVLTSQVKRAADSVVLNIAEGSTGQTKKQFSSFLGYAIRSAIEVVSALYIAKARGLLGKETFEILYNQAETVIKITQALRKSLKVDD